MIKGAIFDVDGTLFDSMHAWHNAGYNYLNSLGNDADTSLGDMYFSMTMDQVIDHMQDNYAVPSDRNEVAKGIHAQVENYYRNEAKLKDGALEVLEFCHKKGIPMTIATSTDRWLIEMALENLGLTEYFLEIYTCTEVGKSKHFPDIFQLAMDRMGSKPDHTWLFEDGLYSMKTAKAYGLPVVGVYDEISLKDQDEIKELVDIYVEDLKQFDFQRLEA